MVPAPTRAMCCVWSCCLSGFEAIVLRLLGFMWRMSVEIGCVGDGAKRAEVMWEMRGRGISPSLLV